MRPELDHWLLSIDQPGRKPTLLRNVPAATSAPSSILTGSRRGAGPKITFAFARGSYSELWQKHFNTCFPSSSTQTINRALRMSADRRVRDGAVGRMRPRLVVKTGGVQA